MANKTERIVALVSEKEKQEIAKASREWNRSVSDFVRLAALSKAAEISEILK